MVFTPWEIFPAHHLQKSKNSHKMCSWFLCQGSKVRVATHRVCWSQCPPQRETQQHHKHSELWKHIKHCNRHAHIMNIVNCDSTSNMLTSSTCRHSKPNILHTNLSRNTILYQTIVIQKCKMCTRNQRQCRYFQSLNDYMILKKNFIICSNIQYVAQAFYLTCTLVSVRLHSMPSNSKKFHTKYTPYKKKISKINPQTFCFTLKSIFFYIYNYSFVSSWLHSLVWRILSCLTCLKD